MPTVIDRLTEKLSQDLPPGADVFQVRNFLQNYMEQWLAKAGQKNARDRASIIMGHLDRIILNPDVLDSYKKVQLENTAREWFAVPLWTSNRISDEDALKADQYYKLLVNRFKQQAQEELDIYDPDKQQEASAGQDIVKHIQRLVREYGDFDVHATQDDEGQYQFYTDIQGIKDPDDLWLGPYPVADEEELKWAIDKLNGTVDQLVSIEGKDTPEANETRFRIMATNPVELPGKDGAMFALPEEAEGDVSPYQERANNANQLLNIAIRELRALQARMFQTASDLREENPDANLTSLASAFEGLIDELTQSSVSMARVAKGYSTLELPPWKGASTRWPIAKVAGISEHGAELRQIVTEANQVLLDLIQGLQENVAQIPMDRPELKASQVPWVRTGAEEPLKQPLGLALEPEPAEGPAEGPGRQEGPEDEPPGGMVPESPEGPPDYQERMLRWEVSMALGAASRGSRFFQKLLTRTPAFWNQFSVSDWQEA